MQSSGKEQQASWVRVLFYIGNHSTLFKGVGHEMDLAETLTVDIYEVILQGFKLSLTSRPLILGTPEVAKSDRFSFLVCFSRHSL